MSITNFMLQDNQTPLYKAALNNHLEIVELLLSKGAEMDSRDKVRKSITVLLSVVTIFTV